jgi:hypothetical protein
MFSEVLKSAWRPFKLGALGDCPISPPSKPALLKTGTTSIKHRLDLVPPSVCRRARYGRSDGYFCFRA